MSRDTRVEIPDKQYFRIGEVAKITKIKPYVLRFWESEFAVIAPQKSRSHQRMYRRRDIETILQIKHLLYDQKFTIKGARRRLAELARGEDADLETAQTRLERIRNELESIHAALSA